MSLFYKSSKFVSIPFDTELVVDFRMRYETHALNVKAMVAPPRSWCAWFLKPAVTDISIYWPGGQKIDTPTTTIIEDAQKAVKIYICDIVCGEKKCCT